ncbi:MAG: hypothetical protein HY831_05345 [Candidatus Aenigmarchaeota archaeon]|nr:hypothetical protein [Candidatus Aenigmarchaeota archaeon]
MKEIVLESGEVKFIVPGLGYVYTGERKVFSILLIIGFLLVVFGIIYFGFNLLTPFGLLTVFVIHLAFAYDAYSFIEDRK